MGFIPPEPPPRKPEQIVDHSVFSKVRMSTLQAMLSGAIGLSALQAIEDVFDMDTGLDISSDSDDSCISDDV